jgi:replicative DNA helicase
VDLLTLSEDLRRSAGLDEVGGPAALASLVEEAATAAHLLSYAGIVREKALLRDLIRIATGIVGQSYEAKEDVDSLLDQAETQSPAFSAACEARQSGRTISETFATLSGCGGRARHRLATGSTGSTS